jgi:hypothetical protein
MELQVIPEPSSVAIWVVCGACGILVVRRRKLAFA